MRFIISRTNPDCWRKMLDTMQKTEKKFERGKKRIVKKTVKKSDNKRLNTTSETEKKSSLRKRPEMLSRKPPFRIRHLS